MPPYNRSSCDHQDDAGTFCCKVLSLNGDDEEARRSPLTTSGIFSDLRLITGIPRQVTFAVEKEKVQLIRGRGDYTNDEVQDCWYTESDFLTFKQEALLTLEIYKKNPARVNNVEYTIRGLEHHLEEVRNQRKLCRLVTKMLVLDDQGLSDDACESNSEHLAKMYSVASMDSVAIALSRAAMDQSEAEEYQCESSSELFNDEWIRCVSVMGKNISYPESKQQLYSTGFSAKEDVSGFDDSWLQPQPGNITMGVKTRE